ncbi:MAG TPA: glycine oxidase ThiO [Trebonia sp.]|nr:glycine oxidase ThiO [Trebonia sp.]
MNPDVVVVGGGVIGTAIAWRAALRSRRRVTIIDPGGDADKASLVAAGMLGPVSESVFGEEELLALNLLAVARFPEFNRELETAAGTATGLRTEGTLSVAYDSGDLAALRRLADFRHGIGLRAEVLAARECRRLEPFLAPNVSGGLLAPGDLSVDNRRYVRALREAAANAGVEVIRGKVATVSEHAPGEVAVTLTTGELITATSVVVAAGWATGAIDGVPEAIRKAVRPVKGQILRLRHPGSLPPILTRTIRALVQGRDIYLVPRADGELVVGATQEERDDTDATAGAVHDLLRDAQTAVPAVSELILAEISVGLRPGSADNGPIVGAVSDGVIVATGHFRNGILLSAATADAVAALLSGGEPERQWSAFTPGRLS